MKHMNTILRNKPHHLAHYEDLVFSIHQVTLGTEAVMEEIHLAEEVPDGFFCVDEGLQRAYVRVFYDRYTRVYYATMTYSPWPSFSPDPVREETGYATLQEALSAVHRIYRYYRHESLRPVPFLLDYTDYCLTGEAIDTIIGLVETETDGVGS